MLLILTSAHGATWYEAETYFNELYSECVISHHCLISFVFSKVIKILTGRLTGRHSQLPSQGQNANHNAATHVKSIFRPNTTYASLPSNA